MERLIATQPWEDNYLENDAYDAAYLFTQGKSAMLLSRSWSASIIEGEESKVKDKVDVITFPGLRFSRSGRLCRCFSGKQTKSNCSG